METLTFDDAPVATAIASTHVGDDLAKLAVPVDAADDEVIELPDPETGFVAPGDWPARPGDLALDQVGFQVLYGNAPAVVVRTRAVAPHVAAPPLPTPTVAPRPAPTPAPVVRPVASKPIAALTRTLPKIELPSPRPVIERVARIVAATARPAAPVVIPTASPVPAARVAAVEPPKAFVPAPAFRPVTRTVAGGPTPTTTEEILARARASLNNPYVSGGNSTTGLDRTACVSRGWGVGRKTTDTMKWISFPISKDEPLSGDALNLQIWEDPRGCAHVRLFDRWDIAARTMM